MLEQDIKRILFAALFLLGPNGEKWGKSPTHLNDQLCILTSIGDATTKLKYNREEALRLIPAYLRVVLKDLGYEHYGVSTFNDDPKTTFDNVKELFTVAIDRIKPLKV